MKVFLRGNPATPGAEAPRRFLSVLSTEGSPAFSTKGSGRLELARAIASPDNPLTARVMVNRVWEHHFGRGLVATPSNFGKMGERPSHPALLDHLARRFVASGWSLKALHREIMLSSDLSTGRDQRPHQRRGRPRQHPPLAGQPPEAGGRALARRDARRLGQPRPDARRPLGRPRPRPTNRRRTFYAKVSRHSLDGLLRLFDFPDPNITADKRTVTAVPLQQLFVLNSEFMERQAKALAARLTGAPGDDAEKVRRAFPLLYARPATDREVAMAVEFLEATDEPKAPLSRWEQYAQVLLGANEFLFVD